MLRAFIVWLGRRLPGKGNRYAAWSGVKQLFTWLCRNRPELVHPGLEIPFNPFPRKNAEARQREALERSEIEAVLAAARCDIDASWARFSEGERALAGADRARLAHAAHQLRGSAANVGAAELARLCSLLPTGDGPLDESGVALVLSALRTELSRVRSAFSERVSPR